MSEGPMDGALRRAWATALRRAGSPIEGHEDPRVVLLSGGIVATLAIDEPPEGRFARVSVRRQGRPLSHEDAVPIVADVYLAGRLEPFPVECAIGADGETLHYAIDLNAYKDAKARDLIAKAAQTGLSSEAAHGDISHAEIAAISLACPLWELARTWDLAKIRKREQRTRVYLSDRFLVPCAWIDFQVEHFLAELAEGVIDENGFPVRDQR